MASSPFYTVRVDNKTWNVHLRSTGAVVAVLYEQQRHDGYRFRLANYSHRMSKTHKDVKSALAAIEREVL